MSIAYAPGRMNLIGEHTDYTGGFVLPMAVSMGVTCTATLRADGMIVASSREMPGDPVRAEAATVRPGDVRGWAAYAIGTAWALREAGVQVPGCDLYLESNLPAGAGLSSSAAVECAVALAILAMTGQTLPAREVARVAKKAENEFVGAPTGSMDQVASMLSKEGSLLFFDTRDDVTADVPFPLTEQGYRCLVVDTHVHHQLVNDEYGDRRRDLERATELLDVMTLRDIADPSVVEQLADDVLRRRARHVVTENARVLQTIDLLHAGEVAALGPILNAGHRSLRDDLEVTCEELDLTAEVAIASGAIGARQVGGGFGGSAIVLVKHDLVPVVQEAITAAYAERGWKLPDFYDVQPARGAHIVA